LGTTITDLAAEIESSAATIAVDSATDQEKCIKQLAQIAEKLAKCHSSQHKESQFDAKIALAHLETR